MPIIGFWCRMIYPEQSHKNYLTYIPHDYISESVCSIGGGQNFSLELLLYYVINYININEMVPHGNV